MNIRALSQFHPNESLCLSGADLSPALHVLCTTQRADFCHVISYYQAGTHLRLMFHIMWNFLNNLSVYPNASLATLFISEIMEGSSFNKAVEIYNPTRFPVSLDLYTIGRVQNGGTSVEGTSNFPDGAVIDSGGV